MRPAPYAVCEGCYALGIAAIVALWWSDGPSPDPRLDAARLAGLFASYQLAVQILLRARLPYIENGVEVGVLARWHRRGGQSLVGLAAAHAALVVWSYARASGRSLWDELRTLVLSYPDVLMATAGFCLFVLVALLATRQVRRRISYQTWSHVHLYVYLAVALTLAHQVANGEHFHRHPLLRIAWLLGWIGLAAAMLWFRVVTPLWRSSRWGLRVAAIQPATPGATTVVVRGRRLSRAHIEAGQYFRWRFLTRGAWWSANPYSLSSAPIDNELRLTAKGVGDHSSALASLATGTRVIVEGPYGALTARRQRAAGAVLVAGGVGVTPLRALFESLPTDTGRLDLIYREGRSDEVLFRAEFDSIAATRGARVHYLIGHRAEHPMTAETLRRLVPDVASRDAYVCAPPGLAEAVRNALTTAGVPRSRVHVEGFALAD